MGVFIHFFTLYLFLIHHGVLYLIKSLSLDKFSAGLSSWCKNRSQLHNGHEDIHPAEDDDSFCRHYFFMAVWLPEVAGVKVSFNI